MDELELIERLKDYGIPLKITDELKDKGDVRFLDGDCLYGTGDPIEFIDIQISENFDLSTCLINLDYMDDEYEFNALIETLTHYFKSEIRDTRLKKIISKL